MREKAKPHPESDRVVRCPFCGAAQDRASEVPWCSGCGAARSVDEAGEVAFDASRKADRQTLTEAERAASAPAAGLNGAARRRPVRLRKKPRPR